MNKRIGKNKISFAEENFEIHSEFEGVVYRNKRNGMTGIMRQLNFPSKGSRDLIYLHG